MSSLMITKLSDICHMTDLFDTSLSSIDTITDPILEKHGISLFVKRDDLIDSEVSGNKWRKLKYNVLQCVQVKNEGILTFGGAYSNHLVATAAACHKAGLKSVGVVRGDELNPSSNETLQKCQDYGMHLHFVSREEYHLRNERFYHEELLNEFPNLWVVPEGGANYWGMIGCQEMVKEFKVPFDRMIVGQGTSTTSCGLLLGLNDHQKLTAVPALKGYNGLKEMEGLLGKTGIDAETIAQLLSNTELLEDYHFGGYAKYDDALVGFMRNFYRNHGIKLDHVYTGKAMYGLWEQIQEGKYDGETIVFVHTGGLQGLAGLEMKMGESLYCID